MADNDTPIADLLTEADRLIAIVADHPTRTGLLVNAMQYQQQALLKLLAALTQEPALRIDYTVTDADLMHPMQRGGSDGR